MIIIKIINESGVLTEDEQDAMSIIVMIIDEVEAAMKHIGQVIGYDNVDLVMSLFNAHTLCTSVRNIEQPRSMMLGVINALNESKIKIEMINAVLQNPIESIFTKNIGVACVNALKLMTHDTEYKSYIDE